MSEWLELIAQDWAPTHGRLAGAARTALAAVIGVYWMMAFRTPGLAPGLFLIFLISYDGPYLTIRNSLTSLTYQFVGACLAVGYIAVTDNSPLARCIAVMVFSFLAAFLSCASPRPALGLNLGIFSLSTIQFFDWHLPADTLVKYSFWPVATGGLAMACKIAVEYALTKRDPLAAAQKELEARLAALAKLFELLSHDDRGRAFAQTVTQIKQYAVHGQTKLVSLLREIQFHPHSSARAPSLMLAPRIARLLDLSTALTQHDLNLSTSQKLVCANLAQVLRNLPSGAESSVQLPDSGEDEQDPLARVSQQVHAMLAADKIDAHTFGQPIRLARPLRDYWLRYDAWTNPTYISFAAKISLCATLCYILYNVLDWRGASTAELTILIAGLASSGATNRKMLLRIIGATLGGVVLGLGCVVFVFPRTASSLPFFAAIGAVTFLCAWGARGAHFAYVGMQMAYSFYLVAFGSFHATTDLKAPCDRVMGILLALLVMWLVLHPLRGERAVDRMRYDLARLIRLTAEMIPSADRRTQPRLGLLREEAATAMVDLRAQAESIPFDLGASLAQERAQSEQILRCSETVNDLFFDIVNARSADSAAHAESYWKPLADSLRTLANGVEASTTATNQATIFVDWHDAIHSNIATHWQQTVEACRRVMNFA